MFGVHFRTPNLYVTANRPPGRNFAEQSSFRNWQSLRLSTNALPFTNLFSYFLHTVSVFKFHFHEEWFEELMFVAFVFLS